MTLNPIAANMTEIEMSGGLTVLFSYKTLVACRWTNGSVYEFYQTDKKWSKTTSRHIKKWLAFYGEPGAQIKPQEYFDNLAMGVK